MNLQLLLVLQWSKCCLISKKNMAIRIMLHMDILFVDIVLSFTCFKNSEKYNK